MTATSVETMTHTVGHYRPSYMATRQRLKLFADTTLVVAARIVPNQITEEVMVMDEETELPKLVEGKLHT